MAQPDRIDPPTEGTAFTFFDYLGLAFILEPPAVVAQAAMMGEPLRWSMAYYDLPFLLIGGVSLFIGRCWHKIKPHGNITLVRNIEGASRSFVVLTIIFLLSISAFAISPLLLWPPRQDHAANPGATSALPSKPTSSSPPPSNESQHQVNQSNAAVEVAKGLSSADRERLANALYDIAQLLDRAVKL
jgi:hypothetical protein